MQIYRATIAFVIALIAGSCSGNMKNSAESSIEKHLKDKAPPNIYGRWQMTKEDNDYPKIRKGLSITEKHFAGWPVIEAEESGSIIFHFTQTSEKFEPGSPDVIQACYIQRVIWNPNTIGDSREFYIDCDERPDYSSFGGSEFLHGPRKVKYNLRISGDHFDRLRFQDHDGLTYYFKRVKVD